MTAGQMIQKLVIKQRKILKLTVNLVAIQKLFRQLSVLRTNNDSYSIIQSWYKDFFNVKFW